LHAVLKSLIENKLIKTEISKQDGRRKLVLPAKLGFSWLKDCSEALSALTRKLSS
jgi:DNA-binding MarR family transcriptional regulator